MLLIEEHLNLHHKGSDGVSLHERNKGIARQKRNKGKQIEEEPETSTSPWFLRYLWEAFWTLSNSRRNGPGGIPEESIRAYQLNQGFRLKHWELEFIRRADAVAQKFWAEKRREERQKAQDRASQHRARQAPRRRR